MTLGMVERLRDKIREELAKREYVSPADPEALRNAIADRIARAVLQEMREHDVVFRDPSDGDMVHELRGAPNDIWRALIDAALSDRLSSTDERG